ncbi:TetR/AcrR family transcriptional regulator [Actinoplanes sp. RD1]|uniref:TetR/AcrR family transcriptional regulator n=1 Tax=Actinoplanes sp. RD1 TaxID=3064538 RepID=UPI002740BC37|nr:TetR/AcrR family transcriptional regulator [Actinoplanes sp. RD1]
MVETTPRRARPRDAAATRRAILDSALTAFSRSGFDGTGTREIAGNAGVDPRLITRYFGSKEGLFTEVVAELFQTSLIGVSGTNREAARDSLTAENGDPDPMLLILRSASNPQAAEIMRERLEESSQRQLADKLPGDDATARAALLLSMCTGVRMFRNIIGDTAFQQTDIERLATYLERALDVVAAGDDDARPEP